MALLEPTGCTDKWTVDEQGLWPLESHKHLWRWGMQNEYKVSAWKPAVVFADDPDAPDLVNTPALPFPFDGNDLAAFLLAGEGIFVADFYGGWESGPCANALAQIDPGNNFARLAVSDAFEAYRAAVTRVGQPNTEAEDIQEFWRWLHAMAVDLLEPGRAISESKTTSPLPSQNPQDIDLSLLADPRQLIQAFGHYTNMDDSWFHKWEDYSALKNAIKRKGTYGRGRATEPLFCPFLVMQGLMKKPRKGSKRSAFINDETPWRRLKQYFPSVYAIHQGSSPLDD